MMKSLCSIILLLCFSVYDVKGQNIDSLYSFIQINPNAVCNNIVYEGTQVFFSADEENLLINLTVANPQLQMRLLMMPVFFYIDPTGRKKKGYAIQLPSATDVQKEMDAMKPEVADEVPENVRPDIMPLIRALNKNGAVLIVNKQKTPLGYQRFYIELDRENERVKYYVLMDKSVLMRDKKLSSVWSFGIFSPNDMNNEPEEPNTTPLAQPTKKNEDENAEHLLRLMQRDIKDWVSFSIDEVNNINIRE